VDSFTGAVRPHDVLALRITPLDGPLDDGWRPWHGQPMYAVQEENVAVQRYESWIPKEAPWRYMAVGGGPNGTTIFQQPEAVAGAGAGPEGGSSGVSSAASSKDSGAGSGGTTKPGNRKLASVPQ